MARSSIPPIAPGDKFGRLTVVGEAPQKGSKRYWLCACECGGVAAPVNDKLRSGHTKSCGCLSAERRQENITKHGLCGLPEHEIWRGMRKRCEQINSTRYAYYGARGIKVCDEWRRDFLAFLAHVGPRPSPKHSIDRIDGSKGYEPGNVRWCVQSEQLRNYSRNVWVVYLGERMCLIDAARKAGISHSLVNGRRERGWPEARWFEPARPMRRKVTPAST